MRECFCFNSRDNTESIKRLSIIFYFFQVPDQYEGMPSCTRSSYSLAPLCKYSVRSERHCGNIHSCGIITLTRRVWALWIQTSIKTGQAPSQRKLHQHFLESLLKQPDLTTNQQSQSSELRCSILSHERAENIDKANQSSLPVWFFLCTHSSL